MGWLLSRASLSKLRRALELAELLLPHRQDIVDALKVAKLLRERQGRDARAGDLEDTIRKLEALER